MTTTDAPEEELPYGGTVRDVRLQIARLATKGEEVFAQMAGPGPFTAEQNTLTLMAHGCSLYGWALASLLRWVGETYGPEAATEAAALVQDMGENGGADWCDDLTAAELSA